MEGFKKMTKKIYVTPELDITEFETEDVITTSSGDDWDQYGDSD